jgi:hypothetical protein
MRVPVLVHCVHRSSARELSELGGQLGIRVNSCAFVVKDSFSVSAYSAYSAVKNLIREIRAIRGQRNIFASMFLPTEVWAFSPLKFGWREQFQLSRFPFWPFVHLGG